MGNYFVKRYYRLFTSPRTDRTKVPPRLRLAIVLLSAWLVVLLALWIWPPPVRTRLAIVNGRAEGRSTHVDSGGDESTDSSWEVSTARLDIQNPAGYGAEVCRRAGFAEYYAAEDGAERILGELERVVGDRETGVRDHTSGEAFGLSPLRRRVACLLAAATQFRSEALRERVALLAVATVAAHIDESRRKEYVYFHHISKAGGSSLCGLSWLNGCRAPGGPEVENIKELGRDPKYRGVLEYSSGGNCWSLPFGDKFTWFASSVAHRSKELSEYSCTKRLEFSRLSGINFFANEGFMPEDMSERPCSKDAVTLEVLREPISRAISHLNHEKDDGYLMADQAKPCVPPEWRHTVKVPFEKMNLTCYGSLQYVSANNYQTRLLAGREGFLRPLGGVTQDDLEIAKSVVARFDVLLLVRHRDLEYPINQDALLKFGVGFVVTFPHDQQMNRRQYHVNLTTQDVEFLTKHNALDVELFRYAEDLYELDSFIVNRTAAFCAEGSDLGEHNFVCEVLNRPTLTQKYHWKTVLGRRRDSKTPFECGCGWAGSLSQERDVPLAVPLRSGLPATQSCPREQLIRTSL